MEKQMGLTQEKGSWALIWRWYTISSLFLRALLLPTSSLEESSHSRERRDQGWSESAFAPPQACSGKLCETCQREKGGGWVRRSLGGLSSPLVSSGGGSGVS